MPVFIKKSACSDSFYTLLYCRHHWPLFLWHAADDKFVECTITTREYSASWDHRLFQNDKVRDCGWGVPHRQAIYKAYQFPFLFHTMGSVSDLHWRRWSLLTVLHGQKWRRKVRVKPEVFSFNLCCIYFNLCCMLLIFVNQLYNAKSQTWYPRSFSRKSIN